jgi:hypothetical protein
MDGLRYEVAKLRAAVLHRISISHHSPRRLLAVNAEETSESVTSFIPCPNEQTVCSVSQGPGTCNALYSYVSVLSSVSYSAG